MNRRSRIAGLVLLFVAVAASAQDATVPAVVIGRLDGVIGAVVADRVRAADAAAPHALIVGEGAWSGADREQIRSHFRANGPIALIQATAAEIAELRSTLGLETGAALPAGVTQLDAYAVDRSADGAYYELVVVPPAALPKATVVTYGGSDASGTTTSTREEAADYPETDDTREARIEELLEWLQQNRSRDAAPAIRQARGMPRFAAMSASAGDQFKPLEEVVRSTESRAVFQFRNNVHTLITNVWSVHNATLNEDWFFVQQKGQFSASNELLPLALVNNIKEHEGNDRGRFTDYYSVNTFVPGLTHDAAVWTEQTSPATTVGVTKVSSSVSWSLSGKLSGNAKASSDGKGEIGGGGEIGLGVNVNNSIAFDVPDVTVRNMSGTMQNNAGWEYSIAPPSWTDGFGCIGFWGLGALKQMSAGTFQPVQQWIWRTSAQARQRYPNGLPLETTFRTRVRHIYYGPTCNWNMTDWKHNSPDYTSSFTVPWPKKP